MAKCQSCGKNNGLKIYAHADGTSGYELYLPGGMAQEVKTIRSHRLPPDLAGLSTESLITYARKGLSDTMLYKQ